MQRSFLIRRASLLLLVILTLVLMVPIASADEPSNTKGFRNKVTLAGIREHQAAFQAIADANDGMRLAGMDGYDRTAEYVFDKLTAAGYEPQYQEFTFLLVEKLSDPELEQVAPNPIIYVNDRDFIAMAFTGSGTPTAAVTAVDINLVPPRANTSGCEMSDFAGFPAGNIALIQRGTCSYRQKVDNATAAGASGVIIFNQGSAPDRMGIVSGTLNPPPVLSAIPAIGISYALGEELAGLAASGLVMRIKTDMFAEIRPTRTIIAETEGGDPNSVVVVGAHLDSVTNPGINDNGSGSATILKIAEEFGARGPRVRNKIRFMWFGAGEHGRAGSIFYLNNLSQSELDKIQLMLNIDTLGSPNFVRFVFDGNNSTFGPPAQIGPPGSGAIEQVFLDYFASEGLPVEPTPFNDRSDYSPFITKGIPVGGLFTGAEGIKTPEQAAIYGGTAGQPYDPCYHWPCDTFANNSGTASDTALDQMSDAVAHAVLYFGKRNFGRDPLVDPAVTSVLATGSGGGLHDHHHEATK